MSESEDHKCTVESCPICEDKAWPFASAPCAGIVTITCDLDNGHEGPHIFPFIMRPEPDSAGPWRIGGQHSNEIFFHDRRVGQVDTPGLAILLVTSANRVAHQEEREVIGLIYVRSVVRWMRETYPSNQHAREWADEIERIFLNGEGRVR